MVIQTHNPSNQLSVIDR